MWSVSITTQPTAFNSLYQLPGRSSLSLFVRKFTQERNLSHYTLSPGQFMRKITEIKGINGATNWECLFSQGHLNTDNKVNINTSV
jgi:hypothetical protein